MPEATGRLFFDHHQWITVEAATARIIPTDQDPGAREAGVVVFIDRYLSGTDAVFANAWGSGFLTLQGKQGQAWQRRIDNLRSRYRTGLLELDRVSRAARNADFVDLDEAAQDAVLGAFARGVPDEVEALTGAESAGSYEVAMSQPVSDDDLSFFETLVLHTRCGFYGDPAYGGNRDFVGWDTIGFPGPRSLAETNDGRYSTLEYMTGGDYAADFAWSQVPKITAAADPTTSSVVSASTLGYDGAQRALAAAVAVARSLGLGACVAVVDRGAHLLSYARMNGAQLLMGTIAQDKAYTAATFGLPTHDWWDMIKDAPPLANTLPTMEHFSMIGGGLPIVHEGEVVGAIGVSGGSPDQDRTIAEAGARAALT